MKVLDVSNDGAAWKRFIESDAKATFCHQFEWKALIRDVLGHESLYLAAVDESGTGAELFRSLGFAPVLGHHLISMPFLNDGGALGEQEAQELLVNHAVDEAKTKRRHAGGAEITR